MQLLHVHRITPSLSLGQMSYKLFSFYRTLLSTSSFFRVMKNSIIHYGAPIHTWVVLQYFHSDDHSDDLHAAEIELGLLTECCTVKALISNAWRSGSLADHQTQISDRRWWKVCGGNNPWPPVCLLAAVLVSCFKKHTSPFCICLCWNGQNIHSS